MIKFVLKTFIAISFIASSTALAGLISDDLVNDFENDNLTFITYQGYDWTWASTVNIGEYSVTDPTDFSNTITNTFEDASFRADTGWMTFDKDSDLQTLFMQLTIEDFTYKGEIIQSIEYWNSEFTDVSAADINNFNVGRRSGEKRADSMPNFTLYETFYVRKSVAVPEPSALFIFSLGLFALALRKRLAR